jgi:hypothetical protein
MASATTRERPTDSGSLIEVLDRVLDKGIVIDAFVRVSVAGVDLLTVDARVVVASVETYLTYAEAISETQTASRPQLGPARLFTSMPPSQPAVRSAARTGTGSNPTT